MNQNTNTVDDILNIVRGNRPFQVQVSVDPQSAFFLGVAVFFAVVVGSFVGNVAAKRF